MISSKSDEFLKIEGLSLEYLSSSGNIRALDDVNLTIKQGEFVALVGESGAGKSTLALSIIGLIPNNAVCKGKIIYKGRNLLELNKEEWELFRGTEIGMIFQEPSSSLNPIERIANQMDETITIAKQRKVDTSQVGNKNQGGIMQSLRKQNKEMQPEIFDWLKKVRIPDPQSVAQRYPFQLSGGMMQRVMISMALSQTPSLLLADEPTSAVDVTTQAQILKLMKYLMDTEGTTIILVTHDLGIAAQVAERIVVMYAGDIVEDGNTNQIFSRPSHPYTQALLRCYPKSAKSKERLETLNGSIPDLRKEIQGCKFAERCPHVVDKCREETQKYIEVEPNHYAKCTSH